MDQYISCHFRWTLLRFASSDGPDCLDLSNKSKRHHSTIPHPTGHRRRWDLRALISSAAPLAVGHVSSHLPLVSLSSPNPKPPIAISGRWQSTWPKHRGIRRRFLDHSAYECSFTPSLSLALPLWLCISSLLRHPPHSSRLGFLRLRLSHPRRHSRRRLRIPSCGWFLWDRVRGGALLVLARFTPPPKREPWRSWWRTRRRNRLYPPLRAHSGGRRSILARFSMWPVKKVRALEKMQQRFCFCSWTGKFKKVSYIPIELFTFLISWVFLLKSWYSWVFLACYFMRIRLNRFVTCFCECRDIDNVG